MVSYYCFNVHFPDDIFYEASFYMLNCHLYIFFSKVSVKAFGPFLTWVSIFLLLSFKSSLCNWVTVFYQMYHLQVFSLLNCFSLQVC